jgi:hypothetical protein
VLILPSLSYLPFAPHPHLQVIFHTPHRPPPPRHHLLTSLGICESAASSECASSQVRPSQHKRVDCNDTMRLDDTMRLHRNGPGAGGFAGQHLRKYGGLSGHGSGGSHMVGSLIERTPCVQKRRIKVRITCVKVRVLGSCAVCNTRLCVCGTDMTLALWHTPMPTHKHLDPVSLTAPSCLPAPPALARCTRCRYQEAPYGDTRRVSTPTDSNSRLFCNFCAHESFSPGNHRRPRLYLLLHRIRRLQVGEGKGRRRMRT